MREGLDAGVDTFPPLSLSSLVSLTSGPKAHLDWKIDTLAFFWTDEVPGFPSGDRHFQPLLHPHLQRIGEGQRTEPIRFLSQGQRGAPLTTPPALGRGGWTSL